ISERKTLAKAWLFWSMGGLFYLYEMVLRASLSVMAEDLHTSFHTNPQQFGLFASMYYWAYTPLQIPCGLILDKVGSRKLITLSCLLCALSAALFGWTESLSVAYAARFFMGAGSAAAFISALALASGWFPVAYFGIMAGLTNLLGAIGGVIAGKPLVLLCQYVGGWRSAMMVMAVLGLGLSVLTWLGIRDPLKTTPQSSGNDLWIRLNSVIRKPQIWFIGVVGGLLYLPISTFAELWMIPFLEGSCAGLTKEKASLAQMSLFFMAAIGGPLLAALAVRWGSYIKVLKLVTVVECILFLCMAMASFLPYTLAIGLSGMIGLITGGQVLVFSAVQSQTSREDLGSAYAFTNALIMGCGSIFQPLLGKILQVSWSVMGGGYAADGFPVYTGNMYAISILSLPLGFLLCWVMLYWVKDGYSQKALPDEHPTAEM
ncbi:MAG: MFS transporter, partial [Alphaproteobacteria bacterium]|nr:MFS transporter [Alphaproteobacteria bacterium]